MWPSTGQFQSRMRWICSSCTFFDTVKDDDIIKELDGLELSTMTPLDALNTLYRLQTKLKNRWKE